MTASTFTTIAVLLAGSLLALWGGQRSRIVALASMPVALITLLVGSGSSEGGWWSTDKVGVMLASVALVIGLCACRFALVQFAGERRGGAIIAASILVVASVVATDLATNQATLIGAWVATSLATIVLLVSGAGSWRAGVVRRAALTFAIADGILVAAVLGALAAPGHIGLLTPLTSRSGLQGIAGAMVLSAAALASIGRAGLSTRSSWVTATVATPTSVSALLHAGVVNAGALLLLRFEVATGSRWWLAAALGLVCAGTLLALAPRIHARVDLKGQLAASTVAQMAFMLLAVALGWPLLALTHLVGHGLYKAGRFMASGGATEARARLRRRAPRGMTIARVPRIAGAIGLLLTAAIFGIAAGGDVLAAMGVFGPAAAVVWWTRTSKPIDGALVCVGGLAGGLALYGGILVAASAMLGGSMPAGLLQAPWWSLGACVGLVAVLTASRRAAGRPTLSSVSQLTQQRTIQVEEVAA